MRTVYTHANGGKRYRVEFGKAGWPCRVMVIITPPRARAFLRDVWVSGRRMSPIAAAAVRAARLEV